MQKTTISLDEELYRADSAVADLEETGEREIDAVLDRLTALAAVDDDDADVDDDEEDIDDDDEDFEDDEDFDDDDLDDDDEDVDDEDED